MSWEGLSRRMIGYWSWIADVRTNDSDGVDNGNEDMML